MKLTWINRITKGILFFAAAASLLSLVVMGLWNSLIPELFNGPAISFWQSLGLLILSHILLRGWSGPWRFAHGARYTHWRKRFDEKLAAMTPEEREKFKEAWMYRCGHFSESTEK